MKLFEIEPQKSNHYLLIKSYKNNKILNKIIQLLKKDGIFKVSELKNDLNFGDKNYKIVAFIACSQSDFIELLKNEIISYIPDNFPVNYMFDFTGVSLGFTLSFAIVDPISKKEVLISHKIREQRTDGTSKELLRVIKI
jgi:hypothetical protein